VVILRVSTGENRSFHADLLMPGRAARVNSLIRQTRGSKDYDADWSQRMKGTGPVAELIAARFKAATKRHGLDAPRIPLDETQFRVPADARPQLELFG
jgi:DNA repair photolyase